jgi:hypothetical protein
VTSRATTYAKPNAAVRSLTAYSFGMDLASRLASASTSFNAETLKRCEEPRSGCGDAPRSVCEDEEQPDKNSNNATPSVFPCNLAFMVRVSLKSDGASPPGNLGLPRAAELISFIQPWSRYRSGATFAMSGVAGDL